MGKELTVLAYPIKYNYRAKYFEFILYVWFQDDSAAELQKNWKYHFYGVFKRMFLNNMTFL